MAVSDSRDEESKACAYARTFRELAEALVEGCNEIEISAELGSVIIRI